MRKTNTDETLGTVERERERESLLFNNHVIKACGAETSANNVAVKANVDANFTKAGVCQKQFKNMEYGITLVALVITIVVLLILARSNDNKCYK